ncbi:hypothetical protein [Yinghuangia seranimata]|uniref:hypothetical protein n=1 Tax=Yinghuangia seranimata TaxID=408067 RepID=UPI00248B6A9E|nr:hypothetical protein [Yinghuangia seranimata]MDI2127603.1 hypothetical protein [Yinghuangia seranimata]
MLELRIEEGAAVVAGSVFRRPDQYGAAGPQVARQRTTEEDAAIVEAHPREKGPDIDDRQVRQQTAGSGRKGDEHGRLRSAVLGAVGRTQARGRQLWIILPATDPAGHRLFGGVADTRRGERSGIALAWNTGCLGQASVCPVRSGGAVGSKVGPYYRPEMPRWVPPPPDPDAPKPSAWRLVGVVAVFAVAVGVLVATSLDSPSPIDDVHVTSCTLSDQDPRTVHVTGTVANPGRIASYRVTVELTAADGTHLDTVRPFVTVHYKETKAWSADLLAVNPVRPGFACRVTRTRTT